MGILIDFPTEQVSDWKKFAHALRETLVRCEVPPELHAPFVDRVRPLFDKYAARPQQFRFSWSTFPAIPESLRQAFERTLRTSIREYEVQLQAHVSPLFGELLDRELRLCYYDFGLEAPETDT